MTFTDDYDEFALIEGSNVRRCVSEVTPGQQVSALVWGDESPEIVFLHGRGQNAHTWDSVGVALGLPMLAVDLPGHGRSDWRADHEYGPRQNAETVAAVLAERAPSAKAVVGMSLGGTTTICLAAEHPELVRRAVIVDITPPTRARRPELTKEQQGATALMSGPGVFNSFEEMLEATANATPGRSAASLRVGVRHNSRPLEDGRWIWRYDRERAGNGVTSAERSATWADVRAITAPVMLVRGGRSGRVSDEDVQTFRSLQPALRAEVVVESGHSVQSEQPRVLAALIADFLSTT